MTTEATTYEKLYQAIKKHSGMDDAQIVEAGEHSADTGWPGFAYTNDCVEFYEANKADIWKLASEAADDRGMKSVPELVTTFGRADMAITADGFKTLMAWFALEEVGRWLANNPQHACPSCGTRFNRYEHDPETCEYCRNA